MPTFQKQPSMLQRGLDPAGKFRGTFGDFRGGLQQSMRNGLDPLGAFGGGGPKKVKGAIDPATGTVTVGNYGKNNDALSAAFTNYLRTGDKGALRDSGGAYKPLKREIQRLQATGWKWGTPTANGGQTTIPGQGPLDWSKAPSMNWGAPQPGGQMLQPAVEPGGQDMQLGGGNFAELNPGGGSGFTPWGQPSGTVPQGQGAPLTGAAGLGQMVRGAVDRARGQPMKSNALVSALRNRR
jgi:hypothetical protein